MQQRPSFILLAALAFLLSAYGAQSLPLSTNGRWVVDAATGGRVKLRCVNWVAHMPAVLPEGLDRRPLDAIAAAVASLGFNCVRLTWATQLWTDDGRYGRLTVAGSLGSLGLHGAIEGIARNNPSMLGLAVREAYDAVVRALGEARVMVVLDNHVSRPQWCCGRDDGNGFFGDTYFDTDEWVRGLQIVAERYRSSRQVVGMSMRNELRGPKQNKPAWYENIALGARTIHKANPNVLVIVSGMSFDTDLSFLAQHPLEDHYNRKLVLEAHWYAFSEGKRQEWADRPLTEFCAGAAQRFDARAGFVTRRAKHPVPLFVSEFGVDQRGTSRADNQFLSCFLAFAAERDLDWALWALQGNYYWRNGVEGFEETYGVLDVSWDRPKNPRFRERFGLIQHMLQDPRSTTASYQLIYHPPSGQCLTVDGANNALLSDCEQRAKWNHSGDGTPFFLSSGGGRPLCLRAAGEEKAVRLSEECDDMLSSWRVGSSSGFGMVGTDEEGRELCLERGSVNSSALVTRKCLCADESDCSDDQRPQWFKIIPSNI
ncbi:uncharacterized protein M6B38_262355 [Iris pallida]|uniref:Glycoside hydrolase family 5 domain-containing protein n=1 Tax=Iris pallida TaxID=29817 RepID=A0AAX6ICH3_IRIPA|nr:uncharacterized protein M6B38_262355 [Iris pallida]